MYKESRRGVEIFSTVVCLLCPDVKTQTQEELNLWNQRRFDETKFEGKGEESVQRIDEARRDCSLSIVPRRASLNARANHERRQHPWNQQRQFKGKRKRV